MSLPEYPFDWREDGRFAALCAARDVLNAKGHGVDINVVDDAIEAAVKAYNATPGNARSVEGSDGG